MHIDLLQTTGKGRGKETHATENGKKTACGINLTKPENIGAYATTGQMTDISQITDITCEKCKTVIAKRMIRENNREMAAMLKEERKRERAAAKHGAIEPSYAPASSDSRSDYVPPSMRRQQAQAKKPIDAPPPAPMKPVSMPAPTPQSSIDNSGIPQVPTSLPGVFPSGSRVQQPVQPAAPADDVLSQFAIPTVPTSLPNQAPPVPQQPVQPAAPVDDVLAQFAIPTVPTSLPNQAPPVPQQPVQPATPVDDVLAQFAIPTVPTSLPNQAPPVPQQPVQPIAPVDDVLAQFAVPTVPTSLPNQAPPVPQQPVQPVAPVDDVLSQFAIPTVPTSIPGVVPSVDPAEDLLSQLVPPTQQPSALDAIANNLFNPETDAQEETLSDIGSFTATVPQADEIIEVNPTPAADGLEPFTVPSSQVSESDDFFVMPGGPAAQTDSIPDLTIPTVPSSPAEANLTVPTGIPSLEEQSIPTLEIPPMPQAQPYPTEMQGFGLPAAQPMPGYPQPETTTPVAPAAPAQSTASSLFSAPKKPVAPKPNTPTPLFVGYSADGRQIFQKFDTMGNPIPITEPVYSAPPEQKQPQITPASIMTDDSPVLDLDDLMSEMGIEDPSKKKQDTGAVVHFTEYKKPAPARKKQSTPKSAQPSGPVSAAEAKRRKKLEKINSQFERDLRARGIDPSTGAYIGKK